MKSLRVRKALIDRVSPVFVTLRTAVQPRERCAASGSSPLLKVWEFLELLMVVAVTLKRRQSICRRLLCLVQRNMVTRESLKTRSHSSHGIS